jgi:hypothetical protein
MSLAPVPAFGAPDADHSGSTPAAAALSRSMVLGVTTKGGRRELDARRDCALQRRGGGGRIHWRPVPNADKPLRFGLQKMRQAALRVNGLAAPRGLTSALQRFFDIRRCPA